MLKDIRLHLAKNDEKQAQLDDELAQQIIDTRKNNINAFQRNIPSLLPYLTDSKLTNYTLFNNKYGEVNIVDYSIGRTLYGFHPTDEIKQQVSQVLQNSPCVDVTKNAKRRVYIEEKAITFNFRVLKSFKIEQAQHPLPEEVECLVVFGCGLGLHIKQLLENRKIKNLIIYEPEIQYFQCSILSTSWQDIFALAKKQGTALFLQLEKDGGNLLEDINELKEHASISSFHVYKHYNHQVFDSVYRELCERDWKEICDNGFTIAQVNDHLEYIPTWTPKIDLARQSLVSTENKLFEKNLQALKKYFPDIYGQYKDYTPKIWLPIKNPADEVNVLKAKGLNTWYGDSPKQDCILNFENFNEQPNKDGLKLGYSGTKLAHYIHYQFVNETQELLKKAKEEVGELPETVASIILFGLGVGYQLEKLLSEHRVEKLFICEPNPDFFYASLFAIDWQAIFEKIEATDGKIYLNVGDGGTDLFSDLIDQFHVIGSYILNNTYFYQSYYNAPLNSAIAQLREQLQIVISMGDNFDYVYYGIEHTKEGFRRNIPLLTKNPSRKLSYDDKEVPVFIVGNGPSLDMSIEAIKECREQAIVISCGTALQALHRNGITPDFHAEIEQNRSTYDWAVLIGDLEYLKKITLISCNGIHPDTCELYKDVLIAFKEGESSTVSALRALGKQHFEVLQQSSPTVSNFVTNLTSTLGFNNIYFMGVDLGFVNVDHHHSKSSGYYQADGKETYDYTENNNTSLVVPGNFRTHVNTKHEFKISRQIIEQVTHNKPKSQIFYNCSDGALIKNTAPLSIDNLLIVSSKEQQAHALQQIRKKAFSTAYNANFIEKYEGQFSHALLLDELSELRKLVEQEITNSEEVNQLIDSQKKLLFSSYQTDKSLLFYYLYGTVNYTNAVFTKLINKKTEEKGVHSACVRTQKNWLKTLRKIKKTLLNNKIENFDSSGCRVPYRVRKYLELNYLDEKLVVVTDSERFKSIIQYLINKYYPWLKNIKILTSSESLTYKGDIVYLMYYLSNLDKKEWIKGPNKTLTIITEIAETKDWDDGISFMYIPTINKQQTVTSELHTAYIALECCLSNHNSSLIIPKFYICDNTSFDMKSINVPIKNYTAYEYSNYLCIYPQLSIPQGSIVSNSGSRGKLLLENIKINHLIQEFITQEKVNELQNIHSEIIYNIAERVK